MIETATNSIKSLVLGILAVLTPLAGTAGDNLAQVSQLVIPQSQQCISLTGPILKMGMTSAEIKELQKVLNISPDTRVALTGPGSPGNETDFFGRYTDMAVKAFQEKYRSEVLIPAAINNPTGQVGMFTRKLARKICDTIVASGLSQADLSAGLINGFTKTKKSSGSGGGGSSKTTQTSNSTSAIVTQTPIVTAVASTTVVATSRSRNTTSAINGKCGAVVNACSAGIYSDKTDSSTASNWSCAGTGGGSAVTCSIQKSTTQTTTTKPATTTSTTPTTNTSTLEWGVFNGYSASDLSSFETLVGKQAKLRSVFTNWGDSFPSDAGTSLKSSNRTLVIFWEQYGVTLDSIIKGDHDAYIKKFATDAKAYGGPVMLSPFHEMNGNWDPWGGTVSPNTPEKVVQAWKHMHDVFGTVSNVKWAWAVNNISVPNTSANAITAYYPGDTYVDIVAVDGFNFGNPWQSFDSAFRPALTTVAQYKKPIYILSMASAGGTLKAAWITDAVAVQMKKYPLLKGWVWFNENKEQDWRVNSDAAALVAFKAVLQ